MTLNDKLKEVIQRNVKDEYLRNCIYLYLTGEDTRGCVAVESDLVTSWCLCEHNLESSYIIVSMILDNIDNGMTYVDGFNSSLMNGRLAMLKAYIYRDVVFLFKKKYGELADTDKIWNQNEEI